MTINNLDLYDYFRYFKNPLNKKYRYEINQAVKKNQITESQKKKLLELSPQALYELSVCVRNGVNVDRAQIGNFYWNRAVHYNEHKFKKANENMNFFD